jgi:ribonuclease BN (tRNA processing enzyme)
MQLRVLGCSGGIGGGHHTTSLLVDGDILIDAGTGLTTLTAEELLKIDHVFITHAHFDHIACLPMIVDTTSRWRDRPLTIYATTAVISILKGHIFNWSVWPDFTRIPHADAPFMRYQDIQLEKTVALGNRRITAIPAEHVVPAVGYHVEGDTDSLVFTGDTTTHDALWAYLNRISNLRYLIIETAFKDSETAIAIASKHFHSSMLADGLAQLQGTPEIYITHVKPGDGTAIIDEIQHMTRGRQPKMLKQNATFEF